MVTQIIDVSASQEHFFPQKTAPAWGRKSEKRSHCKSCLKPNRSVGWPKKWRQPQIPLSVSG